MDRKSNDNIESTSQLKSLQSPNDPAKELIRLDDDNSDDDDDCEEEDDDFAIPEDETSYVFEIGATLPRGHAPGACLRLAPLQEFTEDGAISPLPSRPLSIPLRFRNISATPESCDSVFSAEGEIDSLPVDGAAFDCLTTGNKLDLVLPLDSEIHSSSVGLSSPLIEDIVCNSGGAVELEQTPSLLDELREESGSHAVCNDVVVSQCVTNAVDDDTSPTSNDDSTSDSVCTQVHRQPPSRSTIDPSVTSIGPSVTIDQSVKQSTHPAAQETAATDDTKSYTRAFIEDDDCLASEKETLLNGNSGLNWKTRSEEASLDDPAEDTRLLSSPARLDDFDDVAEVDDDDDNDDDDDDDDDDDIGKNAQGEHFNIDAGDIEIDIDALSRMRICMKTVPRVADTDESSSSSVGKYLNGTNADFNSAAGCETVVGWDDCRSNTNTSSNSQPMRFSHGTSEVPSTRICEDVLVNNRVSGIHVKHGRISSYESDRNSGSDEEEGEKRVGLPHTSSETEVKRALPEDDGSGVNRAESGCGLSRASTNHVADSNHAGDATVDNATGTGEGNGVRLDALSVPANGVVPVPAGLEPLLDSTQLVVHMGNLRHDIFFNVRCEKRMEVIDEMRRLLYYVEHEPASSTDDGSNSFLFKLYDRNKQEVAEIYNPASRTCLTCGLTWHWFKVCHLQAVVYSPVGVIAGFVRRVHTLLVQEFQILSPNETVLLRLRGSLTDLEIYSVDLQHSLGRISVHGWVGVMHEVRRTPHDYGITFPLDLDVHVKGLLLASVFVIDWLYKSDERRR